MIESIEGARCAAHLGAAATATCERCGNYMCGECGVEGQASVCPPCRQRVGGTAFPFHRGNFDLGGVLGYSFEVFKRHWVPLCLSALIIFAASMLLSMLSQGAQLATVGSLGAATTDPFALLAGVGFLGVAINIATSLLSMFVQLWLTLGLHSLCLKALQGQPVELEDLFKQGSRLLPAIAQVVLFYLAFVPIWAIGAGAAFGVGIGMESMAVGGIVAAIFVLFVLPVVIYVSLGVFGMQIELVGDPTCGPIEAMKRSWSVADGQRLNVVLYGLVSSVLMVAGMLACCVGLIPAMALMTLMLNAIYLALRTGADL